MDAKKESQKMLYGNHMLKHLMKKGGKEGTELRLEDLEESVLRLRLDKLDEELKDYKTKCELYKNENDWYQQEMQTCQIETAEYINYLLKKQAEKQNTIDEFYSANKKDQEMFETKKKEREESNNLKIKELKGVISELEEKIDVKLEEKSKLSDLMTKRSEHEAEIARIRKEIQNLEIENQNKILDIEKSLIEKRIGIQREADAKLTAMQSEAHDRAVRYLIQHTAQLETENRVLEKELEKCNQVTQQQIKRKNELEKENRQLEIEQKLRKDLLRIRLDKIKSSQEYNSRIEEKNKKRLIEKKKTELKSILVARGEDKEFEIEGFDLLDLDWSEDDFE